MGGARLLAGFDKSASRLVAVVVALRAAPTESRKNLLRVQEETQIFRPFLRTSFLADRVGFPVCFATSS